jgi:hypothetical protein
MLDLPLNRTFTMASGAVMVGGGLLCAVAFWGPDWLTGGFAPVWLLTGVALFLPSFVALCVGCRCRRCRYKLFWHAVSARSHPAGLNWFFTGAECPHCSFSQRMETGRAPVGVTNAEAVVSAFGFWPSFHDAEVHRATLDRSSDEARPSITLVIHAFASDGPVDEKGYCRIVTSVLVTLKCRDVSVSELRDLGSQNVLSSLLFEPTAEGHVRVTLGPCYGLSGSLVCSHVVVESVVPWRSATDDMPPTEPQS